jgi:hypothetical protein
MAASRVKLNIRTSIFVQQAEDDDVEGLAYRRGAFLRRFAPGAITQAVTSGNRGQGADGFTVVLASQACHLEGISFDEDATKSYCKGNLKSSSKIAPAGKGGGNAANLQRNQALVRSHPDHCADY